MVILASEPDAMLRDQFGPLKYTRFCKVREKKLVYFSGSLNMKILVLKDKNFHFLSPLKYIRFFKVREKKLMYS